METPQSLLQSTILAVTQYNNHRVDRNVEFLQKQIDVLISKTSRGHSLKFFWPGEILPSECLTSLITLISEQDVKHTLLLKCLLLFNNLVSDSTICESLHEKFQLTPALVAVIRHQGRTNSDTLTAEALHLLQRVTYGHRISFEEIYMEDLVKFLLAQICYPSKGLTKPSMGVLVNLIRDNFSVQSFIKNYENMQEFSRKMIKLLGDDNPIDILFSMTLLFTLCLQEKLAYKFFAGGNGTRTFQMIFNILIDGDAGETRRYAVDLLKDILKIEQYQRSLANFEYLGSCLEQTLRLLNTSSPDSVVKIFELLQTLCHVKSIKLVLCKTLIATFPIQDKAQLAHIYQTPLSKIADPLLATIHWAGQSTDTHGLAPLGAYDLLTELYEELVFSHDKVHHEKHAAALLPVILHTLRSPLEGDTLAIKRKIQAMVKGVKLLKALCGDENLLNIISKRLDPKLVDSLLEYQFQHNTVTLLKSKVALSTDDWRYLVSVLFNFVNDISLEMSFQDVSNDMSHDRIGQEWNEISQTVEITCAGVDLVLYLLHLIALTKNKELEDYFFHIMQESQVVPFLASGLSSGNRQRVQDTFSLVSFSSRLAGFPEILVCDALAAINGDREMKLSEPMNQRPYSGFHGGYENKENSYKGSTSGVLGESTVNYNNSMETDVSAESVQSLVEKMNSDMKISDSKSCEIIAIYERALHGLQTKEQHLQDLLEAKTLALNQADRMLAKYRSRKGQDDAEANRVRTLLVSSEKRCGAYERDASDLKTRLDQYVREIEEMNEENQKLKQVAQMHQELTAVHTDMSEKYDALCKSHQVLTQEHKSLAEMHDMLQKHNANLKQQYDTSMEQLDTLQEERRKVADQLRKTEVKLEDTTKASLKWEYDYKRSEEERDTMEMCIDKLRGDMNKLEQKKKGLQEQVVQLEFKISQNEQQLANYDEEVRELKGDLAKHKQITALINSLSSGSEVTMSKDGSAANTSKDGN